MDIFNWINRAYDAYRRRRNWQRVVQAMATVVVFCTTYALILPAITMETDTVCGFAEHTHTELCYETVAPTECTLPESEGHSHGEDCYQEASALTCQLEEIPAHTHGENCVTQSLSCGLEAREAHTHSEDCNGLVETLICTETGETHVHEGTCYLYENGLVCGLEETEGHSHEDACYQQELSCGLEETEGHAHEDACHTVSLELSCGLEESEGHSHMTDTTDPVENLVCLLTEHTHTDACYPETQPETTAETTLPEGDPDADLETAEDWEAGLSAVTLTDIWAHDLLAIAQTQLGYTESQTNYIYDENSLTQHYTRYGAWYGQPYTDWSAMFVSFCLHYAQVDGIGPEQDCQTWLETLNAADIYRAARDYAAVAGDLVFLDRDEDLLCDTVGIVQSVTPGTVYMIAGDWDGRVDRQELSLDDAAILGYAILPENPEKPEEAEKAPHTCTGEDGTLTQVALPADTAVPADAALTVTAIGETDERYAAMAQQVQALLTETPSQLTLLDISFYDAAGEYLRVSDTAQVTMDFSGDIFSAGEVKVFHFVDGAPVELEKVSVSRIAAANDDGTGSIQTQLAFETNGFSIFAMVEIPAANTFNPTVPNVNAMDGQSYRILGSAAVSVLMAQAHETVSGRLAAGDNTDLANASEWLFTKAGDDTNTYTISCNGQYLNMNGSALTLVASVTDATVFTVNLHTDNAHVTIKASNGNYINTHGGDASKQGFAGYNQLDSGSTLYLYQFSSEVVTDLGGQSYAIVSIHDSLEVAMTATADTVGETTTAALDAEPVTLAESGNVIYVNSVGNIPVWTFTAVDAASGTYSISTIVTADGTEKTMYLNLTDGALSLGETAQTLTVTASDTANRVQISSADTYIHSSSSDTEGDFCGAEGTGATSQLLLCTKVETTSSFTVTYDHTDGSRYVITVNLKDALGNDLSVSGDSITIPTLTSGQTQTLTFADISPVIDGYTYSHTLLNISGTPEVTYVNTNDGGAFRFYEADGGYYTRTTNMAIDLVYRHTTPTLLYELNAPSMSDWINAPFLSQSVQEIPESGTQLLPVESSDTDAAIPEGSFVANTLSQGVRDNVEQYYRAYNASLGDALTQANFLAPGKEYRFLGWSATFSGVELMFPADAEITLDADGNIWITDTRGLPRSLPSDTVLTGVWDEYCDAVMFFVNYGDTMLENEDNQTITTYSNDYYVQEVAIAHIYNPVTYDPKDNTPSNTISRSVDEKIRAEIVPQYDPTSEATQIVIDAVQVYDEATQSFQFVAVSNYNSTMLETVVGQYLQNDTNSSTQVRMDGAYIDKSQINSDNYKLYWYLQKAEATDAYAWHIDGVLVAKTQPMEIYKTFSGLTQTQIEGDSGIIHAMEFPLSLIHESTDTTIRDPYTTLKADASQSGVYTFDGRQGTSNIYKWTLESIQGQRYAFAETGYDLDGYDCSSLISVHYTDGTVDWRYNTDTTFTDAAANNTYDDNGNIIDSTYSGTDKYANKPLVGGDVESIIFANFYTPTGTGAFSISKVQYSNVYNRLSGAVFTLTRDADEADDAFPMTVTTNENGAAHFSALPAGTYTLEETTAPAGYSKVSTTWKVEVIVDSATADDGTVTVNNVTVVIWEEGDEANKTTIYDRNNGGIQNVYQIKNIANDDTLTITKYFSGITNDELNVLINGSDNGTTDDTSDDIPRYYIELQDADGNAIKDPLYLTPDAAITGQVGYSWTLADVPEGTYRIVEYNYLHENYLDTAVSVITRETRIEGDTITVTTGAPDVTKSPTSAHFEMTATGNTDSVEITNEYINDFQLKLKKVDSEGNALSGAEFWLYSFDPAEANYQDTYLYTDGSGATRTAYCVGKYTSGSDGMLVFNNLTLSSTEKLYILAEHTAPTGFVKRDDPIVFTAPTYNTAGYANGVLTLDDVTNISKEDAMVTVNAIKVWKDNTTTDHPAVTLNLYQKAGSQVTKLYSTTSDADTYWNATWTDLPYAIYVDGVLTDCTYYVAETPMSGYSSTYSTTVETLTVGTEQVQAAVAVGGEYTRSVTVTNHSGYELPNTGGSGTRWLLPLGLMLMLAAAWLYQLGAIKKKRQGGVNGY